MQPVSAACRSTYRCAFAVQMGLGTIEGDLLADEGHRRRVGTGLLQGNQGFQIVRLLDLLLDARELDQLVGHLVRVHRALRILVLKLCGQQRQEGVKVLCQFPEELVDSVTGVLDELVRLVMLISFSPIRRPCSVRRLHRARCHSESFASCPVPD